MRLDDNIQRRSQANFKAAWRKSLISANLFQFLNGFHFRSTEQITQFPEADLTFEPQPEIPDEDSNWNEVFEFVAPECINLLVECQNMGADVPTVGFELLNTSGQIIATAELAWEQEKIALLLADQEEDLQIFAEHDWQVFTSDQQKELLKSISNKD